MSAKKRIKVTGPIDLSVVLPSKEICNFNLSLFVFPRSKHFVLQKGNLRRKKEVLVRIESECLLGHIFNSPSCDCEWQLKKSMEIISKAGTGLLIYSLNQNGRGVGLENYVKVLMEEESGFDSVQAHKKLNLEEDLRCYRDILDILRFYKLSQIKLLTNNPKRIEFFEYNGIKVKRIVLEAPLNCYNFKDLITKKEKMHHLLTLRTQLTPKIRTTQSANIFVIQ
jgi:3,4-dihydroxy 2-butanone 4-phosphate synthase/GTP cyclohydrolase II